MQFQVYTDSASAIDLIEKCRRATHLEELSDHDDFDLLQLFFRSMSPLKRVFKIKAHQKLNEVQDNLLLYRALGNHVADQTADFACDNLFLSSSRK